MFALSWRRKSWAQEMLHSGRKVETQSLENSMLRIVEKSAQEKTKNQNHSGALK